MCEINPLLLSIENIHCMPNNTKIFNEKTVTHVQEVQLENPEEKRKQVQESLKQELMSKKNETNPEKLQKHEKEI